MPNPFTKHLCSIFLTHPSSTLIIGRAISLQKSTSGQITGLVVRREINSVTEEITLPTDALVLAPGPWLGKLSVELLGEDVGKKLKVTGSQANSIILRTKERLLPTRFSRGYKGVEKEDENEPEVARRNYIFVRS